MKLKAAQIKKTQIKQMIFFSQTGWCKSYSVEEMQKRFRCTI